MILETYAKDVHLTTPVGLFIAGVDAFGVDDLLVPLVLQIWEAGSYTAFCCQGGPPTDPRMLDCYWTEGYMSYGNDYPRDEVQEWVERQGWVVTDFSEGPDSYGRELDRLGWIVPGMGAVKMG